MIRVYLPVNICFPSEILALIASDLKKFNYSLFSSFWIYHSALRVFFCC